MYWTWLRSVQALKLFLTPPRFPRVHCFGLHSQFFPSKSSRLGPEFKNIDMGVHSRLIRVSLLYLLDVITIVTIPSAGDPPFVWILHNQEHCVYFSEPLLLSCCHSGTLKITDLSPAYCLSQWCQMPVKLRLLLHEQKFLDLPANLLSGPSGQSLSSLPKKAGNGFDLWFSQELKEHLRTETPLFFIYHYYYRTLTPVT